MARGHRRHRGHGLGHTPDVPAVPSRSRHHHRVDGLEHGPDVTALPGPPRRAGLRSQREQFTEEDVNQPTQERLSLLGRLQTAIGDCPPHFWVACHLCDLNALDQLVRQAEIKPSAIQIVATQAYSMILTWTQSTRSGSAASTPQLSPNALRLRPQVKGENSSLPRRPLMRSISARECAKTRDGSRCVITGSGPPIEVAHIYPFYLLRAEQEVFGKRFNFWMMLRNFWALEKITLWEELIFPDGQEQNGMESAINLICLAPTVHAYWNQGQFALKPISVSLDKKTLTVQFFWQVRQSLGISKINLTTIPLSTRNLDGFENNRLNDWHRDDDPKIVSGQLFEITTDDPEARPLPSMGLLEMQWFLQRVIGMAGAGEKEDRDYFSDTNISSIGCLEEADDKKILPLLKTMYRLEDKTQHIKDYVDNNQVV